MELLISDSQQSKFGGTPIYMKKNPFKFLIFLHTVKPVYNGHPRDPNIVTVVDRWSLFRGTFML